MICDDICAYLCETSTSIVARSEDLIAKMKFFEKMEWLMRFHYPSAFLQESFSVQIVF